MAVSSGCNSERGPSFALSSETSELIGFAQNAVEDELETGFGTPQNLVVWPLLDVDFGVHSGTITRTSPKPGQISVELAPQSPLASLDRLARMNGAAVQVASDAESVLRVAGFNQTSRSLTVVDGAGAPATVAAKEGDAVTVYGDALQFGRDLYLRHCMHCHGVSGDGNGPTAQYFNVKPRDYRRGTFKFTSTKTGIRSTRDDLYRIVKLGVPGTYMPSFMLLPDEEVHALVEYVRWLAMRGELERKLTNQLKIDFGQSRLEKDSQKSVQAEFNEFWSAESAGLVESAGQELHDDWVLPEEEDSLVIPAGSRTPSTPESIARGRKVFMGDQAKCFSCHGETGRGNGASTEIINDKPGEPGVKNDRPGLFDDWGQPVKPRDLTSGIYRGGRRPLDLYRRVHAGIKGTPMQAFGTTLKDEQIWDVVNYVLSIPLE